MKTATTLLIWTSVGALAVAGEASFAAKPSASKAGDGARISFALAAPTDVEVAVLSADGKVVRHLAAGVLGAKSPPPEPLRAGLAQELVWDGKDDFGKPAAGGPFRVRVRAGTGVRFGRMLGQNPLAMGKVQDVATDAEGNVYLYSLAGGAGPMKQLVMLDPDGNYVRTLLPFPADLPAERVSDWARADAGRLRPINRNSLGPEFYTNADLNLLRVADREGVTLTDGRRVYRIARDGGAVGGKFVHGELWPPKKEIANSGRGPVCLAPSPDGKYLYLSGPFSANTYGGAVYNPAFPPGQVYRMEIGKGTMEPFVKIATDLPIPPNCTQKKWLRSPLADVAVDKDGNVLVCNPEKERVVVYSPAGKELGEFPVAAPSQIVVNPRDGSVYVLSAPWKAGKVLRKFARWKAAKPAAELEVGGAKETVTGMAVSAGAKSTTIWLSGLRGGAIEVADRDGKLEIAGSVEEKIQGIRLGNADRIAVDRQTDTVYVNDIWSTTVRFNGLTGEGGGKAVFEGGASATDVAVGPDGHVYAQSGPKYSGPLGRYTRDLKPAPYAGTGSHLLSKYIYGRYHPWGGNCEKGIGIGRDGALYINGMYKFARYYVAGFGPDGKPVAGKHLKGEVGTAISKDYPEGHDSAVIGPVPGAGGGVRVDSRGRVYLGIGVHPLEYAPPAGYEKDNLYRCGTGTIIRFGQDGGEWVATGGKSAQPRPAKALEMNGGHFFAGADRYYAGLGPMSGPHCDTPSAARQGCCVCRAPRFDLDMYDRLYIPNNITNSVRIVDNSDNPVCEFGAYGNFDSLYVPVGSKEAKPLVAVPEIPLGWPVGVGASERAVYVSDLLNRRVLRADLTWKAEERCDLK